LQNCKIKFCKSKVKKHSFFLKRWMNLDAELKLIHFICEIVSHYMRLQSSIKTLPAVFVSFHVLNQGTCVLYLFKGVWYFPLWITRNGFVVTTWQELLLIKHNVSYLLFVLYSFVLIDTLVSFIIKLFKKPKKTQVIAICYSIKPVGYHWSFLTSCLETLTNFLINVSVSDKRVLVKKKWFVQILCSYTNKKGVDWSKN